MRLLLSALLLALVYTVPAGIAQPPSLERRGVPSSPQAVEPVSAATHDPIAVLDARIEAGEVTVTADEEHGYLRALLDALGIPVSSQGLVFSRTSLQTDRISPWTPRALYFTDEVYVAWV